MASSGRKFPWLQNAILSTAVIGAALWLVDLRGPGERVDPLVAPPAGGGVTLTGATESAAGRASMANLSLNDPTPLFLPTVYNSGRVEPAMTAERSPGTTFGEIDAKWVFPEVGNRLSVPDVVQIQPQALSVIERLAPRVVLQELGRGALRPDPLPTRTALLEVQEVQSGRVVYRDDLTLEGGTQVVLSPMELMVVVDRTGIVSLRGGLEVTAGGGGLPTMGAQPADLDAVQNLLQSAMIGTRISAGIYRILLGP